MIGMVLINRPLSVVAALALAGAAGAEVSYPRLIVVDLKTQRLQAIQHGQVVLTANCSTGRNNATPAGTFRVREKRRYNRALPEFGSVEIPYSLRLDIVKGGRRRLIAIHSHPSVPRRPASHGCIRLKKDNAQKLFGWATLDTWVRIEKETDLHTHGKQVVAKLEKG
ncbi:MAG: hypothetical protein HONBIEJF_01444 [Fimbriimonadaceae bacterium]|nr:hypothetical protein [Fimbriimonadaceae bacterium]